MKGRRSDPTKRLMTSVREALGDRETLCPHMAARKVMAEVAERREGDDQHIVCLGCVVDFIIAKPAMQKALFQRVQRSLDEELSESDAAIIRDATLESVNAIQGTTIEGMGLALGNVIRSEVEKAMQPLARVMAIRLRAAHTRRANKKKANKKK